MHRRVWVIAARAGPGRGSSELPVAGVLTIARVSARSPTGPRQDLPDAAEPHRLPVGPRQRVRRLLNIDLLPFEPCVRGYQAGRCWNARRNGFDSAIISHRALISRAVASSGTFSHGASRPQCIREHEAVALPVAANDRYALRGRDVPGRLSRSTRLRATRIPSITRSRAQTLRWPSPVQGERARSARIAASIMLDVTIRLRSDKSLSTEPGAAHLAALSTGQRGKIGEAARVSPCHRQQALDAAIGQRTE